MYLDAYGKMSGPTQVEANIMDFSKSCKIMEISNSVMVIDYVRNKSNSRSTGISNLSCLLTVCTMKPHKGIFHGTYLITLGWPWYI